MFRGDYFKLLNNIGSIVLLTFGIAFLPTEVIDKTGSTVLGLISLILLILLLIVSIIFYLLPFPTQRRFGIDKYRTNPILSHDLEVVDIDLSFQAKIFTKKTIIFPEYPPEGDRVDIIEIADGEKFDTIYYKSDDSRVKYKVKKSGNKISFFWEPIGKIIPYFPYCHTTEYISPSLYGDDAFFHIHHIDLNTGMIEYIFNCSHEVELAVAFKMPYFTTTPRYRLFEKFTYRTIRRDCEQPVIDDSNKIISWKLISPKINRSYVIIVIYKGQKEKFRNSIDTRNWLFRKLFPDKTKIA